MILTEDDGCGRLESYKNVAMMKLEKRRLKFNQLKFTKNKSQVRKSENLRGLTGIIKWFLIGLLYRSM